MVSALVWQLAQDVQSSLLAVQRAAHAFQRKRRPHSPSTRRVGQLPVLPRNARLTSSSEFARTTKSGIRATTENFVGYLYIQAAENHSPRAGLIVGKSVGNSVQRHRISRQLRHAIAPILSELPKNSLFVIRALKDASTSDVINEVAQIVSTLKKKAVKITAPSGAQT